MVSTVARQIQRKATVSKKHRSSTRLRRISSLSFGERRTGNRIINSENLSALNLLRPLLEGGVRCIYIDPPYNNKDRYTYYHDSLDDEVWLEQIEHRLESMWDLLTPDGSIWISIDDSMMHYLKVLADKVFGRESFVSTIIWQQRTSRENRKVFSNNHDYILVYAKNAREFKSTRNLLPITEEIRSRYKNPDDDPRGPWQSVSANVQAGHGTASQHYELVAPNGKSHRPPNGRCWNYTEQRMKQEIASGNIWWGKDGNGVPRIKRFLTQANTGVTPETLWLAEDVGTNDIAKKHLVSLFPEKPAFDTPKPEQLLSRVLQIASDPGDMVLDAYLGSGTFCSTAHKLGRNYIGIELNEESAELSALRLRQVIKGEQGGVSADTTWTGGGGFDYYELQPR